MAWGIQRVLTCLDLGFHTASLKLVSFSLRRRVGDRRSPGRDPRTEAGLLPSMRKGRGGTERKGGQGPGARAGREEEGWPLRGRELLLRPRGGLETQAPGQRLAAPAPFSFLYIKGTSRGPYVTEHTLGGTWVRHHVGVSSTAC